MLRTRSHWASRSALAIALLGVFSPLAAFGGPWIGVPGLEPVTSSSPSSTYSPPISVDISGYVYVDSAGVHLREPGEWGLSGVTMELISSSGTETATTNQAGFYSFANVPTNSFYSVEEIIPSGSSFSPSVANGGEFLSATGSTLTAPTSSLGISSTGTVTSDTQIDNIFMPPTSTPGFAPSATGGQYALTNVNFGDTGKFTGTVPVSGKLPLMPGVPVTSGTGSAGGVTMAASLSIVGNGDRFLSGSSLGITGAVSNTSTNAASLLNWQIASSTTGVSVSPTSATNLSGGHSTALTGTIDSSSLALGTQTAGITVQGNGTPSSVTASLTIDPVQSRTIDSVSSPGQSGSANLDFGRTMINQLYSAPVTFTSSGSHDTNTDLTLNAGNFNATTVNGSALLSTTSATTLNGTVTQAGGTLSITPTATGPVTSNANFGTSPFTGETLAAGTPVLPNATVPYSITALEPRTLATVTGGASSPISLPNPTGTGGYLYGAVVPVPNGLVVTSTDPTPGPNNATWVYVGTSGTAGDTAFSTSDGTTNVGTVYSTQTTVNGTTTTSTIPVSIGLTSFGTVSGSASLGVISAEAAVVHDTTNYAPVQVQYNAANVGLAATGGVDPTNPNNQLFGAPLIAVIPAGTAIAPTPGGTSLSSFVTGSGTLGSASTVANSPGVTALSSSNYKSTVGTGADILQSDLLASGGTVSMSWRNRNNDENGNLNNDGVTNLPAGIQWANSDVVKIQGVPTNSAFAVQMSFNPTLNTLNEPTSPAPTVQGTYVMELEGSQWVNASSQVIPTANDNPFTAVADSLSDFLQTEQSAINPKTGLPNTLDDLVGSWGVDLTNNESWVILNQGDVILAVAPEPATIRLLFAGGIVVLLVWRWNRRRVAAKMRRGKTR